MKIGPLSNELPMRQPDRPKANQPSSAPAGQEQTDRVEISLDARSRLAELADRGLKTYGRQPEERLTRPESSSGEDTDRISDIRRKIESGYYDRPEIRDQIVDNLTEDLDL
ncbi:MAG: hypothetical protein GY867_12135 [bacterium]|nr:hypothetical protein [bacterium]